MLEKKNIFFLIFLSLLLLPVLSAKIASVEINRDVIGTGTIYDDAWINGTIDNKILTNNNSIVNWITSTFSSLANTMSALGNWSADKLNYYSKTDIDNFNASYLNTTNTSYVPYTGANKNVNLGNNNLTINGIINIQTNSSQEFSTGVINYPPIINITNSLGVTSFAIRSSNISTNLFIGTTAGQRTNTSPANTVVGNYQTGEKISGGNGQNTLFGAYNGVKLTTGFQNVLIGYGVGYSLVTGQSNLMMGYGTGAVNIGSFNTYIGAGAGATGINNDRCLFLGSSSGKYETADNTIILDTQARANETLGRSEALFYGITSTTASNQILSLGGTGKVGINTINPFTTFHVNGSILANGTINATSGFGVNGNSGLTGNYSLGICWQSYVGGIMYATNCTSI